MPVTGIIEFRTLQAHFFFQFLAANTADIPARKMHQAMAEAYRRKADEANGRMIQAIPMDPAPSATGFQWG